MTLLFEATLWAPQRAWVEEFARKPGKGSPHPWPSPLSEPYPSPGRFELQCLSGRELVIFPLSIWKQMPPKPMDYLPGTHDLLIKFYYLPLEREVASWTLERA